MTRPARILLFFVDGWGIGGSDPAINPLVTAHLPTLRALLGGCLPVRGQIGSRHAGGGPARIKAIDATLGVEGRPQSGTGQTALLTGRNAAALLGRHFGPWVPTALRDLLARENLFTRMRALGRSAAFANALPAGYSTHAGPGARRPGAVPFAARAAGIRSRDPDNLRNGEALVSSITTEGWGKDLLPGFPVITARQAGRTLARLSEQAELTVFAHYDTDLAGHRRALAPGIAAIERVDAFLGGLLPALATDTLLVVVSDHGNVEDARTGHTRNPVPLIAAGPGSERLLEGVGAITDVAPCLLDFFDARIG